MISFQTLTYYGLIFVLFWFAFPVKQVNSRKKIFFIINLLFIALLFYFRKKHFAIMLCFVISNFYFLKIFRTSKKIKLLAFFQIALSLAFLCFFKYDIFQIPILNLFPNLVFIFKPLVFIGVSFFTFKLISVIVDVAWENIEEDLDFFHYCNFILFFPCFLSGPLDRYDRFVADFRDYKPLSADQVYQAIFRIIQGAFKKGVIADSLYRLSLDSFNRSDLGQVETPYIFVGQYIYMFVLYFDFSGYSDIAIGVSNLFGVKTPENFNNPYFARNIQEFWNRWHISFMHWLRDYIYFPIQRMFINLNIKNYTLIACIAYLFTFFIAGIWHGDTKAFAYYGLAHGLAFTIYLIYKRNLEKYLSKDQLKKYMENKLVKIAANLLTFHYFFFSLFFFINKTNVFKILFRRWGLI